MPTVYTPFTASLTAVMVLGKTLIMMPSPYLAISTMPGGENMPWLTKRWEITHYFQVLMIEIVWHIFTRTRKFRTIHESLKLMQLIAIHILIND